MTTPFEEFPPPSSCPFCRSPKIAPTSAKVDASTYWRCEACGEMWNPGRLAAKPTRYNNRAGW
ncbi:MAG: hypothetical protein WBD07_16155 [Vicinamibacterales bacterium]